MQEISIPKIHLIPSAKEIQKQAALKEAQKAGELAKRQGAAEAEKRALIEQLSKPSGLSEEEKVKLASTVIQRAVRNGLTEVQVHRFPNSVCTDRGRAINQMEKGWENTLTGIPKEIFQLWSDYLQPRGYRIRYQIIDLPGGVPGDISITISWGRLTAFSRDGRPNEGPSPMATDDASSKMKRKA